MDQIETISTTPIAARPSVRRNELRCLTSCTPGRIVPLAYVPMLREDRLSRGDVRIRVDMSETVQTLMNAINVTAYAHYVPFLAFERFNGLDQLNRSYMGEPETDGGSVVPFFETMPYDRNGLIFRTMGLHAADGELVNSAVVEAYNVLVNFRRKARSSKLQLRTRLDTTLARAFWKNPAMAHIVPDYDAAMIDGLVPVTMPPVNLPVRGLWATATSDSSGYGGTFTATALLASGAEPAAPTLPRRIMTDMQGIRPRVWAELAERQVTLSLANMEMAKQTQAFAELRRKYDGIDEEYLIDLLMAGVRVPDAALSQPLLLDRKSTIVGYSKRYATDGANLEQSVTTGETFLDLRMRTPAMNTGGIILITLEIVPEQLFERQEDHFLTAKTVDDLPSFTRDWLDPEKVSVVQNKHVDVNHATPTGTFGYAPLNHEWQRSLANIGGKFHRKLGDPFVEDRQRIWAVEVANPKLTDDFYICPPIHQNVFADTMADPFEVVTLGACTIVGNTVFGKGLHEATGDYDALLDQIDSARVEQPPA